MPAAYSPLPTETELEGRHPSSQTMPATLPSSLTTASGGYAQVPVDDEDFAEEFHLSRSSHQTDTTAAPRELSSATLGEQQRQIPQLPSSSNDGVFSNLSPKSPEAEMKLEEYPPPYETAAADPTPPYYETTVITSGLVDGEIFVEGMPVGSMFSFFWTLLVSMSFQFITYFLTYLLHTTHAGKQGSRAGLGITLIQYGYYLRSRSARSGYEDYIDQVDADMSSMKREGEVDSLLARAEWLSYIIMVLGWFLVIRSTSEYIRARKMQAVIAFNPESGMV